MKGFYIHIPFCKHICNYCDFYKRVGTVDLINRYVDALVKDIKTKPLDYNTVYIGGGTPSFLGLTNLEKIFKSLKVNDLEEFSIECNVTDITSELLDLFLKYKVTRVSIGVQTFNDDLIKIIGRDHTKASAIEKIKLVKTYPFILNIDMMFALPSETLDLLEEDLAVIKELRPDHISYYSLILEERTVFYKWYLENKIEFVDNDLEATMYLKVMDTLKAFGYHQYENSNFTLDKESVHNKIYWENLDYESAGAGSVARIKDKRYSYPTNVEDYIRQINTNTLNLSVEDLSLKDEEFEYLMMGLRLTDGISIKEFERRFNKTLRSCYKSLDKLISDGFLVIDNDMLKLTRHGLLFQNDVLVTLMEDIDELK